MITKEFVEEKYVKWVNTCNKGGDTDPCYMNTFFLFVIRNFTYCIQILYR